MKNRFFKSGVIALGVLLISSLAIGQNNSQVRELTKDYITYPFSDPDPVANAGLIYPYFRYDGFTNSGVKKPWKIVELENDYIKVQIMPEIGGKIWTAIDKKNNKPFLYDNGVVKFRDIAMRGAWTSGGIEANFGIIGHTSAVATPVDYLIRTNDDGSASCIISNLDLLTRSQWVLEIRLPRDKAYFVTRVHWHSNNPLVEPYYSWMNLAVKASDSLHLIDPGTHYIGHNGEVGDWPIDPANGKNISIYGENNFGDAKSYHIVGTYTKYFGAYWPEEHFGMIHYAPREDKLGKKVFMWALSDAGKIWEKLLTDQSGQYVEIQSGRLFNQNVFKSSYTPFKQRGFVPYQSDKWSEYWYPFSNTGGVGLADLNGVFNLRLNGDSLFVNISSVSNIADTLFVYDKKGDVIYDERLNLKPLDTYAKAIVLKSGQQPGRIRAGGSVLKFDGEKEKALDRPLKPYPDFDYESAYGSYLLGRDAANQRNYGLSMTYIRKSLAKDPSLLPAIVQMSLLQYRKMNYDSAFYYAGKALSIDTYNPEANFYFGLAANALGKHYDALDGFEVASLSVEFRDASFTEMSKMFFKQKDYPKAYEYAARSLKYNADNSTSLQLQLLSARLMDHQDEMKTIKSRLMAIDPSNHFVAFENYWQNKTEGSKNDFTKAIRNELPAQTYLEMAIWYYDLGRLQECKALLEMAPADNEIQYWLAFLDKSGSTNDKLKMADEGSPLMVFPFRTESSEVMKWAMSKTNDWKPRYYLALIQSFLNNDQPARQLLTAIQTPVNFAPFYVVRSRFYNADEDDKKLADLKKATELDNSEWRYKKLLTEYYLKNGKNEEALTTIEAFSKSHPGNYIIGTLYAQTLVANKKFADAEKVLSSINILPFEGATFGHRLFRKTKLMLALEALQRRNFKTALRKVEEAKQWPENLGEGKPYPELINTKLEDSLESLINQSRKDRKLKIDFDKYSEEIMGSR